MGYKLTIAFLFLLFTGTGTINAQNEKTSGKIKLSGIVYDNKTSERVPFTHIVNIDLNKGTSADDHGNFSFHVDIGDSLKFTAIGYEDFFLPVTDTLRNNNFLTIRLNPKTYMLDAMDFYATDPMKGFYLKDIERDTIRINSSPGSPGASYWNGTPSAGTGYITAFANLFNRRHKQDKKLQEILAREKVIREAEEKKKNTLENKYNKEIVRQITELEGEELEHFMAEYEPSERFILNSTRYEIVLQIVTAYRDYRFENGLEVDVSEILKRAKFSTD